MSSKRRRAASRANGKKSHGPVTPEGKARSAANAPSRHGLASPDRAVHAVCLSNENPAEFTLLHEALIAELAPATTIEHLTVHEMAVCRWRHNRALAMETALLDNQMDDMMDDLATTYDAIDEATRGALAFRKLVEKSPSLPILLRYETRLARQFDRCLTRLATLRASREKVELPAEPNPTNEHQNHDTQLQHPAPIYAAQPPQDRERRAGLASPAPTPQMESLSRLDQQHDPERQPQPAPPIPRAA